MIERTSETVSAGALSSLPGGGGAEPFASFFAAPAAMEFMHHSNHSSFPAMLDL